MANKFIVEGVWSGYVASQSRPCHRRVIGKREAALYEKISAIQFTDMTTMRVSVRQHRSREKVDEIHGYDSLFNEIFSKGLTGFVRVADLVKERTS